MNLVDEQWMEIMNDNLFSESAKLTLATGEEFAITGIFYSGSYQQESPAAYSSKRWSKEEWFEVSRHSLPTYVEDPVQNLKRAVLESDRGYFKVLQVKGEQSGSLYLQLQKTENPNG